MKPDNIFLVHEGEEDVAKVLDFGVAKKMGSLSRSSGIKTRTGALLGTPYYISPEQALGKPDVDHRSDIWALGIIAYECITGVRPFERDALGALLNAICNESLPIPSSVTEVPPGFDTWFAHACARIPAERFETAVQAMLALRSVCGLPSVRPSTVPAPQTGGDTVVSAGPRPQLQKPSGVPFEMDQTGVPSSVTIHKGSKSSVKWLSVVVAASLLVVAIVLGLLRLVKPSSALRGSASAPTVPATAQNSANPPAPAAANTSGLAGASPSTSATAPTPNGMTVNVPPLHAASNADAAKSHVKSAQSSAAASAAKVSTAAPLPAPPPAAPQPSSAPERAKTRADKAGLKQANPFSTPGAP
jgi:serine/threonine-protein kinase